jgi:hypothetical protein
MVKICTNLIIGLLLPLSILSVNLSKAPASQRSNNAENVNVADDENADAYDSSACYPAIAGWSAKKLYGVIGEKDGVRLFVGEDGAERSLKYVQNYWDINLINNPGFFQAGVKCRAFIYTGDCTPMPGCTAFPSECLGQIYEISAF